MNKAVNRVLVVDDDDGIRHSLARVMRASGYEVDVASDGESAIQLAESFRPQLVIMDIRMPGIDGVEAFDRIRADHPDIAAIFLTAYSSASQDARAIELGALSVLSKPLDLERLTRMVEDALPDVRCKH